ncbi:hypothetical protein BCR34DRAFT_537611 [Clohesyomyces aquaticus]|uniref:Feruloyl esterase C n=1 Tax=Clohesyomyces aquaticus TaxID=1231657 RepID=A0A1Y1ZNR6_9PLEO|nr:hypothetical protein BCR34DRAFT_537611 [Clohesyomyces aquaticus]
MFARLFSVGAVFLLLSLINNVTANSAGCGKTPTLTSGTKTMTISGKQRQYILRVPDNYDKSKPYRLVFGFHWYGGTMTDVASGQTVQRNVWDYYGLRRLANESTIFVAPQGLDNGWGNVNGDDDTFVDQLLKTIESDLCVNEKLRFAAGFSYGGWMSHHLGCIRASVFRAVAVYSGGSPSGLDTACKDPIAYMMVFGVSDRIEGGRAARDARVKINGCTAQNAPEPARGSLTHVKTEYKGCKEGYPVTWIAFDGGHIAAPQDGKSSDSGTNSFSPGETWKFFTQFT